MSKEFRFLDLAEINRPYMAELDAAARRVISSGRYIGGEEVSAFERNLANACDAPDAWVVGTANGLDALRLIFCAYVELGRIAPGDEVLVPADTYIASVLAITDAGLTPVFVDASAETLNIDTNKLESAITPKTRAMLPVHLYGRVVWDKKLVDVAEKYGLFIVEDCAQAIGAISEFEGLFGSHHAGALGHAGAFSFYPTKNIGALGDAGAVLTHDRELAEAVRALGNYGSDRRYHNIYLGCNSRLDPLQAAFINVKLPYLKQENDYRRKLAAIYTAEIRNTQVVLPTADPTSEACVWHQYPILCPRRDELKEFLASKDVQTDINYPLPPFRQPCYADKYGDLHMPVADRIAREVLCLPITRCTSPDDAAEIAAIISTF